MIHHRILALIFLVPVAILWLLMVSFSGLLRLLGVLPPKERKASVLDIEQAPSIPAFYRRRFSLALADLLLRRSQLPTDSFELVTTDTMLPEAMSQNILKECGLDHYPAEQRPQAARQLLRDWLGGFSSEHARFYHYCSTEASVRDAIAFDCARIAFLVRCLAQLKLVPESEAWLILLLNGQRAQDVFSSWEDFALSYARARAIWTAHAGNSPVASQRALQEATSYLDDSTGNWQQLPWCACPIFDPQPISTELAPI